MQREEIKPLDEQAMQEAGVHWDAIAKPLHSLGKLEDALIKIAGIQKNPKISLEKRALVIMCADNGVVEEGVTQTGQYVTAVVAENFLQEKSCAAIMCRETGTDIYPIDVGMVTDTIIETKKVCYGTKNFRKEPSMTKEEALATIEIGQKKVMELKGQGYTLLAMGEMGIGNTTTSSAIASVLLGLPPEEMTGRGAGLSSKGLDKKISVIRDGISLHKPDPQDPLDVLAKVGGLDIAGLVGVCLGAAEARIPLVLDGFISGVAALVAVRLDPRVQNFLLASHVSSEPAARKVLEALNLEPMIRADMHLGEGTGAITLFPLLDLAKAVYMRMNTFEEIQVEEYQPLS